MGKREVVVQGRLCGAVLGLWRGAENDVHGGLGKTTERGRLALVVRQIEGREGVVADCVWVWRATILFLCMGCLAGLCRWMKGSWILAKEGARLLLFLFWPSRGAAGWLERDGFRVRFFFCTVISFQPQNSPFFVNFSLPVPVFFLSIYRGKKIFFFQMLGKTSIFDFFSKTSNIHVASIRKTNNFKNNTLKVERVQKTFEI